MTTGLCRNSFTSLNILLTLSHMRQCCGDNQYATLQTRRRLDSKMRPAILSGITTGDATLVTVPEVIAKVNSAQFPLVFKVANGDLFLPNANVKFSKSYLSGNGQIALC